MINTQAMKASKGENRMEIGCCARLDRIDEVAAAGFDYIELPVTAAAAWTEEEFREGLAKLKAAGVPAPCFNILFPGEMELLNRAMTDETIAAYLRKAFPRVREMGGRTVVFGSGKCRRRPGNMDYDNAFRRLTEVTGLIGQIAAEHGITVVIEPLNQNETNMVNSVAEGACLRAAVNHPAVRLLGDYYHITAEHQPVEDIIRVGGIDHCHMATEGSRCAPLEAEEGFRKLFAAMKRTGYAGKISVEGKIGSLEREGPQCVSLLKKLWEEA